MASNSDDALLVDLIYAAALDEQQWIPVLKRLADSVDGGSSIFVRKNLGTGQGRALLAGIDPAAFRDYFGYYAQRNPLARSIDHHGAGSLLLDWQTVPKDELTRSEYYNDFLRPRDIHGVLGLVVARSDDDIAIINLTRSPRRGDFQPRDIAHLQPLIPHLRRATLLARRLPPGAQLANSLSVVIDAWHEAAILVGPEGQLRYANRAAEAILSRQDGLTVRMNRLGARDVAAARSLARAIHLARPTHGTASGSNFLVRREPGLRPYAVFVAPIPERTGFLRDVEDSALVVIVDLAAGRRPDAATLTEMLGLSRAQAAIAVMLTEGLEPLEIASALKVSKNTVRRHIADILHRTDTHRQTDLVRLLSILAPRTPPPPEVTGNIASGGGAITRCLQRYN